jgi:hypothetical protein
MQYMISTWIQHIQKKHMYPSLKVDRSQKKHMYPKPEAHHKYNFQNIFHRRMVFQYVYLTFASSICVFGFLRFCICHCFLHILHKCRVCGFCFMLLHLYQNGMKAWYQHLIWQYCQNCNLTIVQKSMHNSYCNVCKWILNTCIYQESHSISAMECTVLQHSPVL